MTTRALVNAYRLLGGAAFTRMLQLLWDAWEGDPRSLTASILSGMALFVKTYETEDVKARVRDILTESYEERFQRTVQECAQLV